MERIIRFKPAYDKRDPDPKKNYGCHGADILFVLKGKLGAVNFSLMTMWHLPHVQRETDFKDGDERTAFEWRTLYKPMASDIGYHSPVPMYEGQKAVGETKLDFDDMQDIEGADEVEKDLGVRPPKFPTAKETGTFSPCDWLDGQKCYCDGSALNAERYFNILLAEGDEGLWKALEEYYIDTFGELK